MEHLKGEGLGLQHEEFNIQYPKKEWRKKNKNLHEKTQERARLQKSRELMS